MGVRRAAAPTSLRTLAGAALRQLRAWQAAAPVSVLLAQRQACRAVADAA